jgi:hypothetical protein
MIFGVNMMTSVGMIQMDCYCGAELFYIGDNSAGHSPTNLIEKLKIKFGSGNIGFFSSVDGKYGDCPYCGLTYELPEPELLGWLPYVDRDGFASMVAAIQSSATGTNSQQLSPPLAHRYLL